MTGSILALRPARQRIFAVAAATLVGMLAMTGCGSDEAPTTVGTTGAHGPGERLTDFSDSPYPVPELASSWSSPATSTANDALVWFQQTEPAEGDGPPQPTVARYERESGDTETVLHGALAPVVSRSGRLAYAEGRGTPYKEGSPYPTDLAVREPDGSSTVWATAEPGTSLVPIAWASDTVLALRYDWSTGYESTVLVRDGGHEVGETGLVLALSPDGSAALVTTDRRDPERLVLVVDTATFAVEDAIGLDEWAHAFLPFQVVDPASVAPGPDGALPAAPYMAFGIWEGERILLSGPTGIDVLTARRSDGGWDVTPKEFVGYSPDRPASTTLLAHAAVLLGPDELGTSAQVTDQAAIHHEPLPEHLTPDELAAIDRGRVEEHDQATRDTGYRCDLMRRRCVEDPSLAGLIPPRADNHSR
jgi:hypothetical protein